MYSIYTDIYNQSYILDNEKLIAKVAYNIKSTVINISPTIYYNNKLYNVKLPNNCNLLFKGNENLKCFILGKVNTENVISAEQMFADCTSLEIVDISNFNTKNIEDMSDMFYNCINLHEIDISNFDLSKISKYHFQTMFKGCTQLKNVKMPNAIDKYDVMDIYRNMYEK